MRGRWREMRWKGRVQGREKGGGLKDREIYKEKEREKGDTTYE